MHKRPLVDRDPLDDWVDGKVVLLGDACHPMTPYMAQGAAMAIEDAAILSRCLDGVDRDGVEKALARYAARRKERTSKMQFTSRQNVWGKGVTDSTGSTATTPGKRRWRLTPPPRLPRRSRGEVC